MNFLAQQVLDRARGELLPVLYSKAQLASALDDIDPPLDINTIDTSGSINRVMFGEGQSFVLDMPMKVGAAFDPTVIANLAQNRHPSYAKGIKSVIELLLQHEPTGNRPTTRQPRSPRTSPDQR